MLPDPFQAQQNVPSGSANPRPFTLLSLTGNASIRAYPSGNAGTPKLMRVSHSEVGSGSVKRDRHLVRFEAKQVVDSEEVDSLPAAALYAVADIPQSGITAAQLTDLWEQFVGCLRGSSGAVAYDGDQTEFFDRWLDGEA